jgi:galactonate dehydratase
MTIISGIEIALWDIKGKRLGMPIYELLGGKVRDSLKVYSWIGGDRPDDVLEEAKIKYESGFRAIKMNGTEELHYIDTYKKVDEMLERVKLLRSYFGNDLDIAVDFHGRVHKPMAKVLIEELRPYRLMFVEEPLLPEHNDVLENLYPLASMPIATGERLYTRWEFKDIISKGVVDIIQPDVILTGGILETRKIAAMAEAYDLAVAPHAPYGPIALAATFQVDACTPNVFIQEQSLNIHYNEGEIDLLDFVKNKEIFDFKDGYAEVPKLPGLGLELEEDLIRDVSKEPLNWANPWWENYDGTIAEW